MIDGAWQDCVSGIGKATLASIKRSLGYALTYKRKYGDRRVWVNGEELASLIVGGLCPQVVGADWRRVVAP